MNSLYSYARNQKNLHRTLVGLIVVISLMMGSLPAAQAQGGDAPELFSEAGAADLAPNNPAHVVRSRFVNVNFGLLFGPGGQALDASTTPEITLNLFPDANYTGVVERVEQNFSGGRTWNGRLKGRNGYFLLVASEAAFIAHIASPEGIYEVSTAGDNLYKVVQIDQSRLAEDAPGLVDVSNPVLLDENFDPAADAASPIEVMVIHTVNARVAEGGTAAMRARIDLAMAETKTSYMNAGIVPRLRLVHVEEVAYTESGNLNTDLTRLRNPSDGILDGMHAVRDIYGADMVAFIVNGNSSALGCGLASAILANAATAFQVSVRECMTGNYTFGHEFGHLQGARHDLFVDPTNTPYAVGHGYVNTAARWRTVMAYNDKCSATAPGTFCPRLLFFSNPTKLYSGAPTGVVGSSENYKVLNATAFAIANFRQRKVGTNFLANFHTTVGPWRGVVGTWTLAHTPSLTYYTSTGAPGVYASAQVVSGYADLTYEARIWRKGCVSCANGLLIRGNPASLAPDKSWQPSYEFSFSNTGYFSVWKVFANGSFVALQDWTATGAIVPGTWNTLKVVAVSKSLKFYINNTLVYSGTDPSFRIGKLGIEFYRDPTSTGNRIFVDWAKVVNTPTGGVAYDQAADVSGTPVSGGNRFMSP